MNITQSSNFRKSIVSSQNVLISSVHDIEKQGICLCKSLILQMTKTEHLSI